MGTIPSSGAHELQSANGYRPSFQTGLARRRWGGLTPWHPMPKHREELQKLTVAVLRSLAKKRLGPGTSKLRTKAQLIAALESGAIAAAPPRRRGPRPAGAASSK